MPRYWVIAPVESKLAELFDSVWQFDLANNLISVGWKKLGDVSTMSREQLETSLAANYPNKPVNIQTLWANMIWAFYHEISAGDFIIARRGLKRIAGVGKVVGSAFHAPGKSPVHEHPNFVQVFWEALPRNKTFPNLVFQRRTLWEVTADQYRKLVEGTIPENANR